MLLEVESGERDYSGLGIIVFDMDGTLVESMDLYTGAFCQVLSQRHGVSMDVSRDVFLSTAGLPLDRQFGLLVEVPEADFEHEVDVLIDTFWDMVQETPVQLSPNATEVLQQLASAGYSLVVSSSSIPSVVISRMQRANLAQYFELLLGTDYNSTQMVKGDGHFQIIRRQLSVSSRTFQRITAMVGDGPHDAALAQLAGIMSIAKVTEKNADKIHAVGADAYIHDLIDLIHLLSKASPLGQVFIPISELTRGSRGD